MKAVFSQRTGSLLSVATLEVEPQITGWDKVPLKGTPEPPLREEERNPQLQASHQMRFPGSVAPTLQITKEEGWLLWRLLFGVNVGGGTCQGRPEGQLLLSPSPAALIPLLPATW